MTTANVKSPSAPNHRNRSHHHARDHRPDRGRAKNDVGGEAGAMLHGRRQRHLHRREDAYHRMQRLG